MFPADFARRYSEMKDDELIALAGDGSQLSPEAQVALEFELEKRDLDVAIGTPPPAPPQPALPWQWQAFPRRIGRLEYFTWQLLVQGIFLVLAIVASVFSGPDSLGVAAEVGFVVFILLAFLFELIVVTPRRCHDLGYSKWAEILLFVPLANVVIGLSLLFKAGSPAANEYGPKTPTRTAFQVIWGLLSRRGAGPSSDRMPISPSEVACATCGTANPASVVFCPKCGTALCGGESALLSSK